MSPQDRHQQSPRTVVFRGKPGNPLRRWFTGTRLVSLRAFLYASCGGYGGETTYYNRFWVRGEGDCDSRQSLPLVIEVGFALSPYRGTEVEEVYGVH